jgi:hypothetical protein
MTMATLAISLLPIFLFSICHPSPRSGRGICSFRQCDRLLASFLVCHHERSEGSAFAAN